VFEGYHFTLFGVVAMRKRKAILILGLLAVLALAFIATIGTPLGGHFGDAGFSRGYDYFYDKRN
jgi:hypothetical protein